MKISTFTGENKGDLSPDEPTSGQLWAILLIRLLGVGATIGLLIIISWVFACAGIAIGVAVIRFWRF